MSVEASAWASDQIVEPLQKLLLLILADNTDCDGIACASRDYLLRQTCMTTPQLDAAFSGLEQSGHITPAADLFWQNGWMMAYAREAVADGA